MPTKRRPRLTERQKAELRLERLLKRLNDPEFFRKAVAKDDADLEEINLAHDRVVRASRLALRHRGCSCRRR